MPDEEERIYNELLEVAGDEEDPETGIRLVIAYIIKNFDRKVQA